MYSPAINPFLKGWNGLEDQDVSVSLMRQQYEKQQALFHIQPVPVQRHLETQAGQIAAAIFQDNLQVKFELPDRVAVSDSAAQEEQLLYIPVKQRKQFAGWLWRRAARGGLPSALRRCFLMLEQSPERAVSTGAGLLRHTTALYIVYDLLPSGRPVTEAVSGEEIATQRYYQQGEAFDEEGKLLGNSFEEVEAFLTSVQGHMRTLQIASFLAPYIAADEAYQQKQSWMISQLLDQGRALAKHLTIGIIEKIQHRAQANDLNRGLSLSLPYFGDQDLAMKTLDIVVIPAGRIGFDRRFVVGAAVEEQARVARDTGLSPSTRHSLSEQLRMLERAFHLPYFDLSSLHSGQGKL